MATLEQRVYNAALGAGMPPNLALLIVAQSKHESGNYSSNLFKKDNNAFGYKYVGQKLATKGIPSPEGDYYAHYTSIEDSTREIASWIKRRQKEGIFPTDLSEITNAHDYAILLKNANYYGAPVNEYTNGLLAWFKSNIKPVAGGIGIVIAIGVFFC